MINRTLYIYARRAVSMALLCVAVYGTAPARLNAQESLSVTVTPPLFQLTIGPGESWASTLKIVNSNPYDVTFYTQVVDMQASGEDGRSKFTPIINEANDPSLQSSALGGWMHVSPEPVFIKAGSSADVPFTVDIPGNAEPGGHYAAILVGTEPGGLHATGTVLKVSSYVSSLLFVRVKGSVVESGRIREFVTSQELYQTPKVDFLLRFENTGNTHVLPQGDITIYNMWGKERGNVFINQDNNFGNVLPKSIRRFQFSWAGESDLFDIGLYSAVVTLTYGQDSKQNVTGRTYFWVVPLVPVSIGLGFVALFLLSLVWFIRRYIRRALELEQKRFGMYSPQTVASAPTPSLTKALIEPIREGVIDLRSVASKKSPITPTVATVSEPEQQKTFGQLLKKYRLLGLFLVLVFIAAVVAWLYFNKVLVQSRSFEITDVHIQEEAPANSAPKKP